MKPIIAGVLGLTLGLGNVAVRADDVCEGKERQDANAAVTRAKAAEAAGNLKQALGLVQSGTTRICSGDGDEVFKRVTLKLGQEAEKAGQATAAFDYFQMGSSFEDAERVGLAQLRATPTDRSWAGNLLEFMRRNNFADGEAEVQKHARGQAQKLLAEEEKSFAIRAPHAELLGDAKDWLRIAGDDAAAEVKRRELARGDQFAALDYPYALQQALYYYDRAGQKDKQVQVKAKARQLADKLAGSNDWNAAAELYELAGDSKRADDLRASRAASAAQTEESRKKNFEKEQGDLEKELGL